MKAAQYSSYGGPEVIEVTSNVPQPTIKDNQVLVEVQAASLNPFDYKLRSGISKDKIPLTFPVTIGGDFAGIISEVGSGVTEYKKGDEIYGQALILSGASGALAEFASANTKSISYKPRNMSFIDAASLPLAGVSALQAIEETIQVAQGQKILIIGGAGGIGSHAIQIAKSHGAYVITTATKQGIEHVKSLGVDQVIDYATQAFEQQLQDLDAVFDTAGGDMTDKALEVIKKGGKLVSMVKQPDEERAKEKGIETIYQSTSITTQRLVRLTELVEQGTVKPQVDKVFPLTEAREAYNYLENGHPHGKVVVSIKE